MLPVACKSKGSGGATWGPNPIGGVGGETEDGSIYIYIYMIIYTHGTYMYTYILYRYLFIYLYNMSFYPS